MNSSIVEVSKGVSVIVCCYNSASRLPKTIEHLTKQITNNIPYEVIIVDNNCTDTTVVVAQEEWNKFATNANFKIVHETTPGLSAARHKGVEEAQYEYIIFCDDDNWLAESYVAIVYEILAANPNIGIVGGQSEALTDAPAGFPDWFETYKSGYAVGKQANETGDITYRKFLWGAGMGFKRELFLSAYNELPSLLTDRKGKELSAGGDSEFCNRAILLGYTLYYDDRLVFKHFIVEERLSLLYSNKLFKGFDEASRILKVYGRLIEYMNWTPTRKITELFKCCIKLCFTKLGYKFKKLDVEYCCDFYFIATGFVFDKTIIDEKVYQLKLIRKHLNSRHH